MKKVLMLSALLVGLTTIQYAEAKGGGGGSSSGRTYARDSHGRFASVDSRKNGYSEGAGDDDSDYVSDPGNGSIKVEKIPAKFSRTQGIQPTAGLKVKSGITNKDTEFKNCASSSCQTVQFIPSNFSVQWAVVSNGYINLYNSPFWINENDISPITYSRSNEALPVKKVTRLQPLPKN